MCQCAHKKTVRTHIFHRRLTSLPGARLAQPNKLPKSRKALHVPSSMCVRTPNTNNMFNKFHARDKRVPTSVRVGGETTQCPQAAATEQDASTKRTHATNVHELAAAAGMGAERRRERERERDSRCVPHTTYIYSMYTRGVSYCYGRLFNPHTLTYAYAHAHAHTHTHSVAPLRTFSGKTKRYMEICAGG